MATNTLNSKVVKATKWSAITEMIAKIVMPISNIVLARILAPEAFGIVATITMVVTFAEVFTDAGFQKYLIQHIFSDDNDLELSTNVAFWSNFMMSLFFWIIIILFRNQIAMLVGNPGMGIVLVISSVSIPIAAFSSIQMALYKRALDFKTLFKVRIIGVSIPLIVTIPLALLFKNFWALIIGILVRDVVNAIMLTVYSSWKPRLYYSIKKFKEMFSFTSWSLLESISIWFTGYIDIFIVGAVLNQYYLGLYKTSVTLVSSMISLITASTTPVLFSSLSKLQNNNSEFELFFCRFQKIVSIFVVPLGVIIYCYSDFITVLLLGDQWEEAAGFVGLWGLSSSIVVVLSNYASEVYRSKGLPKLSVLSQVLHILALWPAVLIAVSYGFEILYTTRALVRFQAVAVDLIIMYYFIKLSPLKLIINILPSFFASLIMATVSFFLKNVFTDCIITNLISISVCAITYLVVIVIFKKERQFICGFYKQLK